MATPTRAEIEQYARELWHNEQARQGNPAFGIEPELCELRESGLLSVAQSELMRDRTRHTAEEWQNYAEQTENFGDFQINVTEAMKSGCYVSGTTGTGKSDIGMYAVKALMERGVIVIVFDSTQDWQSRSSIARVQTLRTPHISEVPEASTVFDISLLKVLERQKLIESFCGDIYRYQAMTKANERRQYFLIFEEAHNYFKEGFMRAKRFSNSAMLLSEGRNYEVRFMCITQFASLLDKIALKYMRLRFFGFSSEPNDCEYISRFFPRDQREQIETKLRNLAAGQFLNMQGKIVSIEPFESNTIRKQIAIPETLQPKPIKPLPTVQKPDYGVFAKTLVVGGIGLLWLLLTMGGH